MPAAIATGYPERLAASADYVRDCRERYQAALAARNDLIVNAVDDGLSGYTVARAVGLRQPQIIRICSESQPDAHDQR
ncbi:hypothetical protein AB0K51_12450 [Kitasatospora sp. NPDC049285]|uniref:hypothetical protein n=1 Tax=Kitasatospora sp. NPDC049285 TaxID=3157096 RepID=UPI00342BBD39